jgi:hypothetical protein
LDNSWSTALYAQQQNLEGEYNSQAVTTATLQPSKSEAYKDSGIVKLVEVDM